MTIPIWFAPWGVKFDLGSCKGGLLKVCNTEKRVKETTTLLDEILMLGALKKRDALVVRGRLAFCDALIFGRLGKVASQELTRHAYASPFSEKIPDALKNVLKLLEERFWEVSLLCCHIACWIHFFCLRMRVLNQRVALVWERGLCPKKARLWLVWTESNYGSVKHSDGGWKRNSYR